MKQFRFCKKCGCVLDANEFNVCEACLKPRKEEKNNGN